MEMQRLAESIINGYRIKRGDDIDFLLEAEISDLSEGADKIRKALCGDHFDLCSIINGKSGKCSENCKFCAQSAHNCTNVETYDFLDEQKILRECSYNEAKGVHYFSIVTAGRMLSNVDFEKAVRAYRLLKSETKIGLCASHGLLTEEQFRILRDSGVKRYHCNIETSRRKFPDICTSHSFDDKINCIKAAKKCGFQVCSGGIIGMGENWYDRIDMALTLAELEIDSIPINILNPIKGTPLEDAKPLTNDDILRTIAIFRYIVPEAYIRMAGGRGLMADHGRSAFMSGANASITGDMLTTSGSSIEADVEMISKLGYLL